MKKLFTLLFCLFAFSSLAFSATYGYTTEGGNTDSNNSTYYNANCFYSTMSCTLSSYFACVWSASGGQIRLAIYNSNTTPAPTTLLANTSCFMNVIPTTEPAASYTTWPSTFSATTNATLSANTSYWIAASYSADAINTDYDNSGATTNQYSNPVTFSAFPPGTYSIASQSASHYSIGINVTPVGASATTNSLDASATLMNMEIGGGVEFK